MGLLIYFVFLGIFAYGFKLADKNKVSNVFVGIAFVLMIFEFMAVLGDINIQYKGYPIEHFSTKVMYYIAVLFYYIGYLIWSIIALLLVYIPILVNKKKLSKKEIETTNTKNEDKQLLELIGKLEQEKEK